ncbi:Spy/CpxP family protein refolding chaperone [Dysgonomonas sp. 25]|uniref:Spy/CpxP family protein refolding chaperone n=1 Tax=Dysgonomonas sp. 25 TaxID=2302933 RepID=UPI0013D3D398|nr:Spy/CpxP family protein refolding chaperone [Dysgonomonas sp. 25]NDV68184.1 hypothetical protein [Dysgonomonas sp. 25]
MKNILILAILLLGTVSMNAQQKGGGRGNFDLDAFKAERMTYFTKELKLTDAQAKTFAPIFNEFMSKKFQANKEARTKARDIHHNGAKSEASYRGATQAFLDAKVEEAKIQKEYYKKLESVLTAEQLYNFSKVEMDFMKNWIEKNNRNHHHY